MNQKQRQALYVLAGAAIALLAAYGIVSEDKVPLWMSLVTSVLWVAANVTQIVKATDAGRAALYGLAVAAAGLLSGYGILADEKVPVWLAVVGAVLGLWTQILGVKNATPDDPAPVSLNDALAA
jgi:hypothetical protein